MGLSDVVRGLLSGEDPASDAESDAAAGTVVYECRNCGTTVGPDATECPNCDSTAIVEYPIE
ncbi:hypothetical protein [Natronobiforma cellulositropha]|uniref:hypothetical protein n=1 Tax=Natronobiforma cellulositropha TaxID=1679076 RepID=UPI0021D5FDEE|nr:hypothetical protein [Natronobiforma cellulositropha]